MRPARYVANFDSAAAMLRATARFLKGKDFPGAGATPPLPMLGMSINALPRRAREALYRRGGWGEAIPPRALDRVDADEFAGWVVSQYPKERHQAVAIGSSSGALVHLCAALRIPWLPQTLLIGVRQRGLHPDEPRAALDAARGPARRVLGVNPQLQLHHMHDPNQDRLMIRHMMYFRMKRLLLGRPYESFIRQHLMDGGSIVVVECRRTWPTSLVSDRHIFQMGALGGATPEEFFDGSQRVAQYLESNGSHRRSWDPPEPDGERAEAEWGFEPALSDDIEAFARRHGYRLRRLIFQEPEDLSEFVAELYRWWYRRRGMPARRLLIESFVVLEPYWALRTGSVPLWMKFNMEPSANMVERYLDSTPPYDEIGMMLFSHGVESIGFVPMQRWQSIVGRAGRHGRFIGMDEARYPRDFGVFTRYNRDLKAAFKARHPIPPPLTLDDVSAFAASTTGHFPVTWT